MQVSAPNKESITAAISKIKAIVAIPEVGEVYDGTIRSVMPYGCFVEIMPGKDGLLHISEIDWKRLETVEEAGLKEGDKITVKLMDIDQKTGKYKLSHRVLIPKPEGYVERERARDPSAVRDRSAESARTTANSAVLSTAATTTTSTILWHRESPKTSTTVLTTTTTN